MNKIIVELTGDSPLIMNNPVGMRQPAGGRKQIPEPAEEAKAKRYLMPDGKTLALKADHLHRCLILASSGFRVMGKQPVQPYISGSLEIQPEWVSLGTQKYEVDVRRVVVQRQGVLRARPVVWPWKAKVEVHYDEEVFSEEFLDKILRDQIFVRAGKAIGLLDYRPAKGGRFGRFHVAKWDR